MRISFYFLMFITLTSCTINENDELEFTWLFWALLGAFILFFIISLVSDNKEAKKRGISVDQVIEEKKRNIERRQMARGFEVEYLGGWPKWVNPGKVNFGIENNNIILTRDNDRVVLSPDNIIAISNEKSGSRSVGKAVGGAIAGGLLTGGVGLIVGGALGARRNNTSEIYITYRYNNSVELTMNLRPGKNTDKVYAWINSVYA